MSRVAPGLAFALALLLALPGAWAHPLRTGYLELQQTAPDSYQVLWAMPAVAGEWPAVALDFAQRCEAPALPPASYKGGQVVRTWSLRCPGGIGGTPLTARGLAAAQMDILVRVVEGEAAVATGRLAPMAPTLLVPAEPGPADHAWTYLRLGVEHILLGVDHLLFVTALMLLVDRPRRLIVTITAFTLAHSLTLGLAVVDVVRLPGPPVEALIAISIALAAAAGLRQRSNLVASARQRPWRLAFVFGLLHGLGFAGALGEIGLPAGAVPLALLFFNLGVELGQLAFVAALLAVAAGWRRLALPRKAWLGALVPYAIGSVAMFWTIERVAGFWG